MEYNKSVSNPLLMGAIELVKAEDTPAHKKMVSDEIVKAVYMTPARVTPVPPEGETKLPPGSNVQLPVIAAPNGKQFFLAFTDKAELKKWKDDEEQQTLAMTFDDYAMMMFRKDNQGNMSPVSGIVINPMGANIIVPKEMVAQYVAAKMAKERGGVTPPDTQN